MISDKNIGNTFLTLSCLGLLYMFIYLIIVPILPLANDNPLKLSPPIEILFFCGMFGFTIIGTLLCCTIYFLYRN